MRALLDDVMTGRKTQLAASGLAPSAASTGQQGSAASVQQQTLQQLQVLTCFPLLGLCDSFCGTLSPLQSTNSAGHVMAWPKGICLFNASVAMMFSWTIPYCRADKI